MARPKSNKTPQPRKPAQKITCLACGITKTDRDFYVSSSVFNAGTGRVQYCKDCCISLSCNEDGTVNIEKFKDVLSKIDKPFLPDVLQSAYDETNKGETEANPIGIYFKNINSLPQYKGLHWRDSDNNRQNSNKQSQDIPNNNFDFKVTKEMILKWGSKFEPEDYYDLEQFCNDMTTSNNIETASDKAYLKKLAVISLKMDKALQDGLSGEAKQLGDLFSKYMADSKFRAMDKTDADKTGGIRNFGAIYAEVEKDGFIPPWDYYRKIKGITQDIVDKTIMHIENFTLKLNKVEKMITPPLDTPKLEIDEIDTENTIEINDIEVDETYDDILEGDENGIME